MADAYDVIVIGGGGNGLVAAVTLARAGRRVLVAEAQDMLGGQSRSREFAPGFRSAPLGIDAGWLPPAVARELGPAGLARVEPKVAVTGAIDGGGWLSVNRNPERAAESIRRHSARDADRWGAFVARIGKLAGFLEALYQLPPPDIDTTALGEVAPLLGLARRFRALGRSDMIELLRVLPMSVQDLLDEWFETPALAAAVGAGGVRDLRQGPRSGGTSFVLLHYLTGAPPGSIRARGWWRDGPDAFTQVAESAARRLGVTIRATAPVSQIMVRDDAVTGIVLAGGEEVTAPVVLSTADPVQTLLGLVDPVWLDPEFLLAVRKIKLRGCTAIVQYALDGFPDVPELANQSAALASIVSLTPTLRALEQAYDATKYGQVSEHPHVEITVPTLRWLSLAPPGQHVMVARVQYAPYRLRDGGTWDDERSCALADRVTAAIASAIPGFADRILHRHVTTAKDLEVEEGPSEGALTHGELTLDQILFMRPVAGWGRYAMPVDGLYLGGSGAHPGPRVLGAPGWLAARRVLADRRGRGARS